MIRTASALRNSMARAVFLALLPLACSLVPVTARAGQACAGYEHMLFCGELSNDCTISAVDALAGLRMAVALDASRPEADLDNSGVVTTSDALKILRIGVGSQSVTASCGPQYGLNAIDTGFYFNDGGHLFDGYAVGWYANNMDELRNYLTFDLSPVDGTIASAMLHLSTGSPRYKSVDASETFTLFDIATGVTVLANGTGGVAAYNDLGEGTVYGTLVATSAMPSIVDIPLNAAGVAHLDASTGKIALGGALTTLTKGVPDEYIFNSTGPTNYHQLILTVE